MRFDVVVVGAGPGGSAAAWEIARSGASVLLCDKATFPRDKTCGDGVTPRGVGLLYKMGLKDTLERFQRFSRLRVHVGSRSHEEPWPDRSGIPGHGYVVPRTELDQLMVDCSQQAGATFRDSTRLLSTETNSNGTKRLRVASSAGEELIDTPLLIAADGAPSGIGRSFGLAPADDTLVAVAARAQVPSARPDDEVIEMHALRTGQGLYPGYGWVFPMGAGRINVGVGVISTYRYWKSVNAVDLMDGFLESLPSEWNVPQARSLQRAGILRAWRLPMGLAVWPAWQSGLMLVGDAAGVAKPSTGAGISKAIQSGLFAGEVAIHALASGDFEDLSRYGSLLDDLWGAYYKSTTRFLRRLRNPLFLRVALETGIRFAPVQALFKKHFRRG